MFKKLSTVHLLGILVVLALIFVITEFVGDKSRSSSFKSVLVEIDTSSVSRLVITKGNDDPFEIDRSGDGWELVLPTDQKVRALKSSVKGSLSSLQSIKPSRLVSKQPDKWSEFQVDTAGTRVEIYQGNEKSLDLVIGRFGVQGQRSFYTYVRLFDDHEVYAANDFMGMSFGSEPGSYRFKEMVRLVLDSVDRLSFVYPGDSSFTMTRSEDKKWWLGEVPADSASARSYLNGVRFLSGSEFVDDIDQADLREPDYSVVIQRRGNADLRVNAYRHPGYGWLLNSNHNPDSWFSDAEKKLFDKLFPGPKKLLAADE